jgi:hypothetical protein
VENKTSFSHPPILKDEALNHHLFQYGYACFPLLDQEEVELLRRLFFEYHSSDQIHGLYISAYNISREKMYELDKKCKAIFSRGINANFWTDNFREPGTSFIVKANNTNNELHPHQDWSIVDETRFRTFTVWTALQDINEHNGAMHVLPGSHEWIRGYRHITIDSVYGKVYDLAWKHSKPIYMKAGEALIFDHALAHASKPNCSSELRICATYGIASKESEPRICINNNGTIEEYACSPEFYLDAIAKTGPFPFPKIRDVDFKPVQLNEKEFCKLAGVEMKNNIAEEIKPNQGKFFLKIRNIFNGKHAA